MRNILFIIVCLFSASVLLPSTSTVSFYSVSISLEQDTLHRVIEIRGVQGSDRLLSRISRGFNPETQSISLERSVFGTPEGGYGQVPEWAVDTLTGSGGWQLALVVAFPALREGMTIDYRVDITDWSRNWEEGPWAVLSPYVKGIRPDTCRFSFTGEGLEKLNWQGAGYEVEQSGGRIEFTASDSSEALAVSPFGSFGELEDFILRDVNVSLNSVFPPDLREAALQATSAGADEYAQTARARSLLCNSISFSSRARGRDVNAAASLQEILDRRKGTALEIALVFAAMCRELGMEADILPACGVNFGIPVPEGWDRFLVKTVSDEGDDWYTEPSGYLTPAMYVFRPDTLYVIENGNLTILPPNEREANSIRENWYIDFRSGTFRLEMECRGWYDMILRKTLAGLSNEEMLLSIAEWSWLSGKIVIPDSVSLSDPFDLGKDMELCVQGMLWYPMDNSLTAAYLPVFDWSGSEEINTNPTITWSISGIDTVYSSGAQDIEVAGDRVILLDTSGTEKPFPVILRAAE